MPFHGDPGSASALERTEKAWETYEKKKLFAALRGPELTTLEFRGKPVVWSGEPGSVVVYVPKKPNYWTLSLPTETSPK